MGFGPTDTFLAHLKQMQAEGEIISPGELVRRVNAGPGPESLGWAQQSSAIQASAQLGIEADILAALGRLESAWSGPSGDAARESLRPLADVATSASTALHVSQNTLTDQIHAFISTRYSLQDVSDDAPSKSLWDKATPWDTDNEDLINQRNAAIQQNNTVYQAFTTTSNGHAQKMPIDYGQVPDAAEGTYTLDPAQAESHVQGKRNHRRQTVVPNHADIPDEPVDRPPGSTAVPSPAGHYDNAQHSDGQQQSAHAPTAAHGDDGTHTSGYVPSAAVVNGPPGFSTGNPSGPSVPGAGSSGYNNAGGYPTGSLLGIGGSAPGVGSGASPRNGPSAPGKATGTGRFGGAAEPRGATGPGAAGVRGANGMPLTAGTGKGDKKEEDEEHQTPDYLQEADPGALFGYDGKATPPVIGK